MVLPCASKFFVLDFFVKSQGDLVKTWQNGILDDAEAGVGEEVHIGALRNQEVDYLDTVSLGRSDQRGLPDRRRRVHIGMVLFNQ